METLLILIHVALLFVPLIHSNEESKCFISGHCLESPLLTVEATGNEILCLRACQERQDCQWFSYSSELHLCEILADCENLDLQETRTWVSGKANCTLPECDITGLCQGHVHNTEYVSNKDECLLKCKSDPNCLWFTYFSTSKACIQFTDCPTIDETCTECTSGEFVCQPDKIVPQDLTKLVIATGNSEGTILDTIEVLDLSPDSKTCDNLPNFPGPIFWAVGGVHNYTKPMICGGFDENENPRSECFALEDGQWTEIERMLEPRAVGAITAFPSDGATSNQDFLVIGGENYEFGFVSTVNAYTDNGWILMNSPLQAGSGIIYTCAVTLDSTTAMLIGGMTVIESFSSTIFLFDGVRNSWDESEIRLLEPRHSHSCGVIRTEDAGNYVIVAGGFDTSGVTIATTEILEPGQQEWRKGPSLPQALYGGVIVEDIRSRSVIYVGGQVGGTEPSPNLYRLSAPITMESQWKVLPQQLKTPRIYMTAFFIPDNFVECHDNTNEVSSTLEDS